MGTSIEKYLPSTSPQAAPVGVTPEPQGSFLDRYMPQNFVDPQHKEEQNLLLDVFADWGGYLKDLVTDPETLREGMAGFGNGIASMGREIVSNPITGTFNVVKNLVYYGYVRPFIEAPYKLLMDSQEMDYETKKMYLKSFLGNSIAVGLGVGAAKAVGGASAFTRAAKPLGTTPKGVAGAIPSATAEQLARAAVAVAEKPSGLTRFGAITGGFGVEGLTGGFLDANSSEEAVTNAAMGGMFALALGAGIGSIASSRVKGREAALAEAITTQRRVLALKEIEHIPVKEAHAMFRDAVGGLPIFEAVARNAPQQGTIQLSNIPLTDFELEHPNIVAKHKNADGTYNVVIGQKKPTTTMQHFWGDAKNIHIPDPISLNQYGHGLVKDHIKGLPWVFSDGIDFANKDKIDLTIQATQVGGKGGSNPGGMFHVPKWDNSTWYIKWHADHTRIQNEFVTNQLLTFMGVSGMPDVRLAVEVDKGQLAHASLIVPDAVVYRDLTPEQKMKAASMSARHIGHNAVTSNWDFNGLDGDNLVVSDHGEGGVWQIDNGGGLLFRAEGQLKTPEQFYDLADTLERFANPSENKGAYMVLNDAPHYGFFLNKQIDTGHKAYPWAFHFLSDWYNQKANHGNNWVEAYINKAFPAMEQGMRDAIIKSVGVKANQLDMQLVEFFIGEKNKRFEDLSDAKLDAVVASAEIELKALDDLYATFATTKEQYEILNARNNLFRALEVVEYVKQARKSITTPGHVELTPSGKKLFEEHGYLPGEVVQYWGADFVVQGVGTESGKVWLYPLDGKGAKKFGQFDQSKQVDVSKIKKSAQPKYVKTVIQDGKTFILNDVQTVNAAAADGKLLINSISGLKGFIDKALYDGKTLIMKRAQNTPYAFEISAKRGGKWGELVTSPVTELPNALNVLAEYKKAYQSLISGYHHSAKVPGSPLDHALLATATSITEARSLWQDAVNAGVIPPNTPFNKAWSKEGGKWSANLTVKPQSLFVVEAGHIGDTGRGIVETLYGLHDSKLPPQMKGKKQALHILLNGNAYEKAQALKQHFDGEAIAAKFGIADIDSHIQKLNPSFERGDFVGSMVGYYAGIREVWNNGEFVILYPESEFKSVQGMQEAGKSGPYVAVMPDKAPIDQFIDVDDKVLMDALNKDADLNAQYTANLSRIQSSYDRLTTVEKAISNGYYLERVPGGSQINVIDASGRAVYAASTLDEIDKFIDGAPFGGGAGGINAPPPTSGAKGFGPEGNGWDGSKGKGKFNITRALGLEFERLTTSGPISSIFGPMYAKFTAYSRNFGVDMLNNIFLPVQRALKEYRAVLKIPNDQLAKISKKLKHADKVRRELYTEYRETFSAEEMASGAPTVLKHRALNENELRLGDDLSKISTGEDRGFINMYMAIRRMGEQGSKEAAKMAKNLLDVMTDTHKQILKTYDDILSVAKDEVDLYAVRRYADAIEYKTLTRDEFAKKHGFTADELSAMKDLDGLYDGLATLFDIPLTDQLGGYHPHYRLYNEAAVIKLTKNWDPKKKFFSVGEFVHELDRTGEMIAYVMDPVEVARRYMQYGAFTKIIQPVANAAENWAIKNIQIPDRKALDQVMWEVRDYLGEATGRFRNGVDAVTDVIAKTAGKDATQAFLGKLFGEKTLTTLQGIAESAVQGFRPFAGIRDFTSFGAYYFIRFGPKRGLEALKKFTKMTEAAKKLITSGKVPGLELDQILLAEGQMGNIPKPLAKFFSAGFKWSLQNSVYLRSHIATFLETKQHVMTEYARYRKGEISFDRFADEISLDNYDSPQIKEFLNLLENQSVDRASDYLGEINGYEMVGYYGMANQSPMFRTRFGRLAGQFGQWNIMFLHNYARLIRNGRASNKLKIALRASAVLLAAKEAEEETGVRFTSFIPLISNPRPGPVFSAMADALTYGFSNYDVDRQTALSALEKELDPMRSVTLNPIPLYIRNALQVYMSEGDMGAVGRELLGIPLNREDYPIR